MKHENVFNYRKKTVEEFSANDQSIISRTHSRQPSHLLNKNHFHNGSSQKNGRLSTAGLELNYHGNVSNIPSEGI